MGLIAQTADASRAVQAGSLDRDRSRCGAESRGRNSSPSNDSGLGIGGRGRSPGLTRCAGGLAMGGLGAITGLDGGMWPWR